MTSLGAKNSTSAARHSRYSNIHTVKDSFWLKVRPALRIPLQRPTASPPEINPLVELIEQVGTTISPPVSSPPSVQTPSPPFQQDTITTLFRWPAQLAPYASSVAITGDFLSWGPPLPLTRTENGDWIRSIALPPGPIHFKFILDEDNYQSTPTEAATTSSGGATNNYRLVQPTAVFTWPSGLLGGKEVFVAGSWSNWSELLPLRYDADTNEHSLTVCLPPGNYAFSFLVDGQWKLRPDLDSRHTSDGHFGNIIDVALPEAFRVLYSTGWKRAGLKFRRLDGKGRPLIEGEESWEEVALHDTNSRESFAGEGRKWKVATVYIEADAELAVDHTTSNGKQTSLIPGPQQLEFFPVSLDGDSYEDHPPNGQFSYVLPSPGGYKLKSGRLRPFSGAARPPLMLVSDLDGTLVGEGTEADTATAEFGRYWENNAALTGGILVYNTGRSLGSVLGLLEEKKHLPLPLPDAIISAVGTKIFLLDREKGTRGTCTGINWTEDDFWAKSLDRGWDLDVVRSAATAAMAAAPSETVYWLDQGTEHPHRIALSVRADVVKDVEEMMLESARGCDLNVQTITSGTGSWRYLDVLPLRAGKLNALEYIRALYSIPKERCVAAGDSGNDKLMLQGGNKAIVVGNAQEELMDWVLERGEEERLVIADGEMGRGVLEGLMRLGLY